MAKLAFLGAGMISAGMIEASLKRGDQVTVYNRTHEKAQALVSLGAAAVRSPAEAVSGAERVHVVLSDDAAVDSVLDACGQALRGAVVLDHSTVLPAGTTARAARLAALGVDFLHAPVFMSPQSCRESSGMMLLAGPSAIYEKVASELAKMTGTVKYLGERPHIAAAYKLFGNAMLITIVAGLADVFAMAASMGLDPREAITLYEMFNPGGVIFSRGKKMAQGDYQAAFELSMARKDIRLMIETAQDQHLAVLPGIAARMDALLAEGFAADDMGVLAVESVPKK